MEQITTTCCIAGGGPAGMMLGLLLARAGVDVVVLEKHADFLRDFRGDTIHPSTLEVIHELGLLDEFLKLPHRQVRAPRRRRRRHAGADRGLLASADALQVHRADAAMGLPQFPRRAGRALSDVHLRMDAEVTDLIEEGGRVVGVRATTPDGPLTSARRSSSAADGRALGGARARRAQGRRSRRADRRAVDAAVAAARRRRRGARPHRRRADAS